MSKTRSELHIELENLEKRLREVKKNRKITVADFKDQIGDVEDQLDDVLKELQRRFGLSGLEEKAQRNK